MGYILVDNNLIQPGFNNELPLGISLNFQNPQLFLAILSQQEQALQNLKNLLLTKTGERVGLPTYGCDLLYILFQPNLNDIKDQIKQLITDPVSYWLPYIQIIDIVITTNEDNPNLQYEIEIKIVFSVDENADIQSLTITANDNGTITANGN